MVYPVPVVLAALAPIPSTSHRPVTLNTSSKGNADV